jgi:hypothetical protein
MASMIEESHNFPSPSGRGLGVRALLFCACAFTLSAPVDAAGAVKDALPAMRVRRIAPPVPVGKLVLHASGGQRIRLSDFGGKAVLVEFFMTN